MTWITVTQGATGAGNGTVAFSVAANASGAARTGTLTVAGQLVTVSQAGTPQQAEAIELRGAVSDVTGTCPLLEFTLDGRTVRTNSSTRFPGNRCDQVSNGAKIKVNGTVQPDGIVLAAQIVVQE